MTEDRPPATPGPAQTPAADDLDALDRKAAELQGWVLHSKVPGVGRPPGESQFHYTYPSPTRDPGDALRLLEFTLQQHFKGAWHTDMAYSLPMWTVEIGQGFGHEATLSLAITRACCAALEAVSGVRREGEAGAK